MKRSWYQPVSVASLCMAAVFLVVFPLTLVFFGGRHGYHPLLAAIAAVAAGVALNRHRINTQQGLEIAASRDHSVTWEVKINDVKVGAISDASYAAIKAEVLSDPRVYTAQIMNVLYVVANSLGKIFLFMPAALFWLAVGVAILRPDDFASVIDAIHKASPADFAHGLTQLTPVFLTYWVIVTAIAACFGMQFGFVDRFKEAALRRVRVDCDAPSEGYVTLLRWHEGEPVVSTYFGTWKPRSARDSSR